MAHISENREQADITDDVGGSTTKTDRSVTPPTPHLVRSPLMPHTAPDGSTTAEGEQLSVWSPDSRHTGPAPKR